MATSSSTGATEDIIIIIINTLLLLLLLLFLFVFLFLLRCGVSFGKKKNKTPNSFTKNLSSIKTKFYTCYCY
jgi:heme/copper-type cytochrome/quinol oxidase subunit 2